MNRTAHKPTNIPTNAPTKSTRIPNDLIKRMFVRSAISTLIVAPKATENKIKSGDIGIHNQTNISEFLDVSTTITIPEIKQKAIRAKITALIAPIQAKSVYLGVNC